MIVVVLTGIIHTRKNGINMNDILMSCGCVAVGKTTAIGGVKFDPPIPVCITHNCHEVAESKPSLSGRRSRCGCMTNIVDSSYNLPFFEYRGHESRAAKETCKSCRYDIRAHDPEYTKNNNEKRTVVQLGKCSGFEPTGGYEFDTHYCGHSGWD